MYVCMYVALSHWHMYMAARPVVRAWSIWWTTNCFVVELFAKCGITESGALKE